MPVDYHHGGAWSKPFVNVVFSEPYEIPSMWLIHGGLWMVSRGSNQPLHDHFLREFKRLPRPLDALQLFGLARPQLVVLLVHHAL